METSIYTTPTGVFALFAVLAAVAIAWLIHAVRTEPKLQEPTGATYNDSPLTYEVTDSPQPLKEPFEFTVTGEPSRLRAAVDAYPDDRIMASEEDVYLTNELIAAACETLNSNDQAIDVLRRLVAWDKRDVFGTNRSQYANILHDAKKALSQCNN